MHRQTLYVGLVVILLMCLVPPFEASSVDQVGDVMQGAEVQAVEYAPIWSRFETGGGLFPSFGRQNIDGGRLLLQILFVAGVTAVIAYNRE